MSKPYPLHEFRLTGDIRLMLAWGQKHFPPADKKFYETVQNAVNDELPVVLLDKSQLQHIELLAARLSGSEYTIASFELERKAKQAAASAPLVQPEVKPMEKQRSLF